MDLRVAIFSNWGYKLASLVVVSLLWLSLSADERQSQPVRTLVTVEVLDSAWVLVNASQEVSTTFQGRNRDLLGLLVNEPEIPVVIDSVTEATMEVDLNPALRSGAGCPSDIDRAAVSHAPVRATCRAPGSGGS